MNDKRKAFRIIRVRKWSGSCLQTDDRSTILPNAIFMKNEKKRSKGFLLELQIYENRFDRVSNGNDGSTVGRFLLAFRSLSSIRSHGVCRYLSK